MLNVHEIHGYVRENVDFGVPFIAVYIAEELNINLHAVETNLNKSRCLPGKKVIGRGNRKPYTKVEPNPQMCKGCAFNDFCLLRGDKVITELS